MVVEGAYYLKMSTISKDLRLTTGKMVIQHYSYRSLDYWEVYSKRTYFPLSRARGFTALHRFTAKQETTFPSHLNFHLTNVRGRKRILAQQENRMLQSKAFPTGLDGLLDIFLSATAIQQFISPDLFILPECCQTKTSEVGSLLTGEYIILSLSKQLQVFVRVAPALRTAFKMAIAPHYLRCGC